MSRLHPVSDEVVADSSCVIQQRSLYQIQQLLKGLKIWKDLDPHVQLKLPTIVYKVSEKQGAVVFSQGDAPGHCYIVMSGEVAIWIRDENDQRREQVPLNMNIASPLASSQSVPASQQVDGERDTTREELPMQRGRRGSVPSLLPSGTPMKGGRRSSVPNFSPANMPNFGRRHSAPHIEFKPPPQIDMGKQVATLGQGAIFGELALMNGQPRSATVTCITDCEFLIIERTQFDAVLKREMERFREDKLKAIRDHVPGMRELPSQRIDKTLYCFAKEAFPKGHVFLRQGEVAQRSVFLVVNGNVEFRCKQETSPGDLETHCVARLVKGGLFGSSPSTLPEPFSAVATKTACEVYSVNDRSIKRLPIKLELGIRKYIAETTLWHLQSCNPVLSAACLDMQRPSSSNGRRPSTPNTLYGRRSSTPNPSRPGTPTRNKTRLSALLQTRSGVSGRSVAEVLINGKFVQSGTIDFAEISNPRPIFQSEKGRRCTLRGQSASMVPRLPDTKCLKKHKSSSALLG